MSSEYFNSDDRIAKLMDASAKLFGTPWAANSDAPGSGIACHNLPRRIYIESGFLPETFPRINGTPDIAAHQPIMEEFLDKCFDFARIPVDGLKFQTGDLLGLWLAADVHGRRVKSRHTNHLGVVLRDGWFMHVLAHKKSDRDLIAVPPWSNRIVAAWRPIIHSNS